METKKTFLQRTLLSMIKNGWTQAIYNTAIIALLANSCYHKPWIIVKASIICIWWTVISQNIKNYILKNN